MWGRRFRDLRVDDPGLDVRAAVHHVEALDRP
jgi:hypothetical protein